MQVLGEISRFLLVLTTLLVSARAIPMMPFSPGMMGFGSHGMMGTGGSYVGASYRSGVRGQATGSRLEVPLIGTMRQFPTRLTGIERFFSPVDNSVAEGMRVIIQQVGTDDADNLNQVPGWGGNLFGGGMLGYGSGMYGTSHGLMGALGGLYGAGSHGNRLEAIIEVLRPVNSPPESVLVVFTEPAVSSTEEICPVGPVLTEPLSKKGQGLGFGFGSPFGMLGGFRMGMSEPQFGVIADVSLQPGSNTFQIRGLGDFTKISQMAGHGVALCLDVQIGLDRRPFCSGGKPVGCVKLGFNEEPEPLAPAVPPFLD